MRKLASKLLMLSALVLLGGVVASCQDTPEEVVETGTLTAEATNIVANTVEVSVTTDGISEYAWSLGDAGSEAPAPIILFKDGNVVVAKDGVSKINLEDLEYQTTYRLYIAAKAGKNTLLEDVTEVRFTTGDYTDDVTIIRLNYDGADIHVKLPEAVKQRGNKLKWMVTSVPYLKDWKPASTGMYWTDAEMLQQSDINYPMFLIHRDTTLRITEANRIFTSPYDGELNEAYQFIAPGEPLHIAIQEVLYTESGQGYGAGWYGTPFLWEDYFADYNASNGGGANTPWSIEAQSSTRASAPDEYDDKYWPENSWRKKIRLVTKQPDMLEAGVNIGYLGYDGTANLSPKGGKVTFTPEEGVFCYCVMILDHSLYQTVLLNYLEGKRDLMQWYTTSYHAAWTGLTASLYSNAGPASIDIAEWFNGNIIPGGTYHVLVTAMAGKEGEDGMEVDFSRQSFVETTFEVPNYTLPAPEMKVTGLKSDNPFEVKFNIKCTTADTNPVEKASFACNYARDFSLYLNSYNYTLAELVAMNTSVGLYFSDAEVKKINSPEGYDITISSREDAASGLVAMGWNYEGRPSNPDAEGAEAYAEARSPQIPDAERVESPLFTELLGDWTATTTLHAVQTNYLRDEEGNYIYDEEGNLQTEKVNIEKVVKSKVTIGDLVYPETITDEVYKVYGNAGVSKAETEAYFAEFQELAANFNRKVRGQNRLLCQGLDFDELENVYGGLLDHQSAWDLFVSSSYSSSSVEDAFYDFGPKWHLQIDKDGNVFVPVNVNRILPLTNWRKAEVLFFGYNPDTNEALMAPQNDSSDASTWPNLPVEISEDKNSITIKPFVYNYTDEAGAPAQRVYYPNMIINSNTVYGMFPMTGKIKGDIVLTRGWNETITVTAKIEDEMTRAGFMQPSGTPIKSANGAQYIKKNVKARTNFEAGATRVKPSTTEYTAVKVKGIDSETLISNIRTAQEQTLAARGMSK